MPFLRKLMSKLSHGMTLMELVIAVGMVGMISLGVMQMTKTANNTQKSMYQSLEASQAVIKAINSLQKEDSCSASLTSLTPSTDDSITPQNIISSIRVVKPDGSIDSVLAIGDVLGNRSGRIIINNMYLAGLKASSDPQLEPSTARAVIIFRKGTSNTAIETIKKSVEVKILLGATGAVTKCSAHVSAYNKAACESVDGFWDGYKCLSISIDTTATSSTSTAVTSTGDLLAQNNIITKGDVFIRNSILDPDKELTINDDLLVNNGISVSKGGMRAQNGDINTNENMYIRQNVSVSGLLRDSNDDDVNFANDVISGKTTHITKDLDVAGNISNSDGDLKFSDPVEAQGGEFIVESSSGIIMSTENTQIGRVEISQGQPNYVHNNNTIQNNYAITKSYAGSMFDYFVANIFTANEQSKIASTLSSALTSDPSNPAQETGINASGWLVEGMVKAVLKETVNESTITTENYATSNSSPCANGYIHQIDFTQTSSSGKFTYRCTPDTTALSLAEGGTTFSCPETSKMYGINISASGISALCEDDFGSPPDPCAPDSDTYVYAVDLENEDGPLLCRNPFVLYYNEAITDAEDAHTFNDCWGITLSSATKRTSVSRIAFWDEGVEKEGLVCDKDGYNCGGDWTKITNYKSRTCTGTVKDCGKWHGCLSICGINFIPYLYWSTCKNQWGVWVPCLKVGWIQFPYLCWKTKCWWESIISDCTANSCSSGGGNYTGSIVPSCTYKDGCGCATDTTCSATPQKYYCY